MNLNSYHKRLRLGGKYRAGRKSASPRIDRLLKANKTSLRMIAREVDLAFNKDKKAKGKKAQENGQRLPSLRDAVALNDGKREGKRHSDSQGDLTKVLQDRRNTPRLVKALEESLGYPIDFLRQIYREDREQSQSGNPISYREALDWYRELKGIHVDKKLQAPVFKMRGTVC